MAIKIFYTDLRVNPSKLVKYMIAWSPGLTAKRAVETALDLSDANSIVADLARNSAEVTVAWNNLVTGESSDVGGVDSLDWDIEDHSVLTITHENANTSQQQIDESIEWLLANEK